MNICNKPPNKTAPEKTVVATPEVQSQHARRNGWSWPPHPFQIIAWLLYLFFALIGFGILVPLLPQHWVPAGYICPGVCFICHLVVHFTAVSIDPADEQVREKNYQGQLTTFNRSHHTHVIENHHCHVCDVDVSSKSKHCGTCNKCVCGFDHHCKWLNNCVGERNYWLFLNSVVSAILGLVLLLLVALYVFVEFFINPMRLRTNQHFEGIYLHSAPAILVLAGILILLGLLIVFLLGHLLIFHIYLMWNKLTTYEYIVQQRPPQEMKEADRHLKSCPPQVRLIQVWILQTKKLFQQQKKRRRRRKKLHKDPSLVMDERSKRSTRPWPSLPAPQPELSVKAFNPSPSFSSSLRLPIPAFPLRPAVPASSLGTVQASGPPADYHSESAESMDEIPVAQTCLGSAAPTGASKSSLGALLKPSLPHRKCASKQRFKDQEPHLWDMSQTPQTGSLSAM
uniref:Palmitoyltransferase n=1 Tax=Sphenodon punctatus TaxID=8508 RepID=A0A8D0L471_SPHPU